MLSIGPVLSAIPKSIRVSIAAFIIIMITVGIFNSILSKGLNNQIDHLEKVKTDLEAKNKQLEEKIVSLEGRNLEISRNNQELKGSFNYFVSKDENDKLKMELDVCFKKIQSMDKIINESNKTLETPKRRIVIGAWNPWGRERAFIPYIWYWRSGRPSFCYFK
jgi:peptidoglycan hydrolase CwlO-like protein